jgi:hypothetical protein
MRYFFFSVLVLLFVFNFIALLSYYFVDYGFAREPSSCNRWGICVYPDGSQICCFPDGSLIGCAGGCCDCVGPFV